MTDTYSYDANGNRISKNATSYSYDAADQMTAAGGVSYGYDLAGNQTGRGSDTFTYDHANRLTQTVIGGTTSSSVYNGDGLRLSHTVGGATTNYTWDVNSSLPVVLQDGTNSYVYGLNLVSSTDAGGAQTYVLYDGLGSITGLTDGSGNNPVSYSYDVFGAIRTQTGSSANQWLFTGEQRDSDSSMYYLRARYYDPVTGRFLGRDPVAGSAGDPQSQNRYSYAQNSPTNLVDPSGLSPSNGEGGQSGWYHGKRFGWWFLGIAPPTCAMGDAQCWFDYANNVLWPAFRKWVGEMTDATADLLSQFANAYEQTLKCMNNINCLNNALTIADLAPTGAIPWAGPWISATIDISAFSVSEYYILFKSGCDFDHILDASVANGFLYFGLQGVGPSAFLMMPAEASMAAYQNGVTSTC